MKRIITLLTAAVMVVGAAGLAGAVEFKASGHMHLNFSVLDNTVDSHFDKNAAEDNFFAAQRFRPKLTMKADGVTAVFEVQQQQAIWGSDWPMGGNPSLSGTSNGSVRIRQAYVDFNLPNCPVSLKVGYQQLSMPSIWGHPVLDSRVGGAVASIPFGDQAALSVFWARPQHNLDGDKSYNSVDLFGALLPLDFNTVKATPYLIYGRAGADSDTTTAPTPGANQTDRAILGGVNVEIIPMDALSVKVDGIVTNYDSDDDARDIGTGWMAAVAVDYEMPWGAPGVFGWYATGADEDGEGALFSYQTDGFGPSSWGFAGGNTFAYDSQISDSGVGTWAVGVQIADMSAIESLKHTVRVLYVRGTNDKDSGQIWTTKDSFIEVNLDSTWSIYENLAAVVELGGLVPDLGSATKAGDPNAAPPVAGYEDDFAWKAQLTLRFSF